MANRWNRGANNYYPNNYGMATMPYYMPSNDRRYNNYGGKGYYRDDKKREDRKRPHSPSKDRHGKGDRESMKRGGKYDVRVPRNHLAVDKLGALEIRTKLPRLNVPGDFSNAICDWTKGFPIFEPFGFSMDADFHLFHREVETPFTHDSSLIDIPDADFKYSARVMLLGTPSLGETLKNSCKMADEVGDSVKYSATKNYNFLLGGRVRNEAIPLGGPWSPSLDGSNPEKDQTVLIKTAIRNFKGLTGVDLSGCTRWINFLTLKYHRRAGSKAPNPLKTEERTIEQDCVETVVIYIPVFNSILPNEVEWQSKKEHYTAVLNKLLNPESKKEDELENKEQNGNSESQPEEIGNENMCETSSDPTPFDKLDTSSMKVNELRSELAARGIDSKGLKNQLQTRLQEALDKEKAAVQSQEDASKEIKEESESDEQKKIEPIVVDDSAKTEEDTPATKVEEMSERDKRRLERLYRLENKPAIIIHPNTQAKDNTFDCHRASLCSLLDYRHDEVNEMNFEVVLFAQQFHEMLLRDSIFNIFKAIYLAPDTITKSENKENGESEPEHKKVKEDESTIPIENGEKVRKHKRTVNPELLYSFVFFDTGHCEYIKDCDLLEMFQLIDTGLTKNLLKELVHRVSKRKDHLNYRILCDKEVEENSEEDIVNLNNSTTLSSEGIEKIKSLISKFRDVSSKPSQIVIGGGSGSANLTVKYEEAMKSKKAVELQFFKLKEEYENVRVKMNGFQDVEDALRLENSELQKKLKSEQKNGSENRSLVSIYSKILKDCKFHLDKSLSEINRQFEKEKEKRDAEKAELERKQEEKNKEISEKSTEKKEEAAEIVVDTA